MNGSGSLISRLKAFWYIGAESRELESRPLAATIMGERLVFFRAGDGSPRALLDRCAHRGMALSRGRVRRDGLECPYHGWRYDGDGRCLEVPALADGAPPPRASVRAFPCAERDGYIWVYMGNCPPSSSPPHLDGAGEPGWTTFRMKTRFQAGVLACLENFLDCPHTVYVHRGWFRNSRPRPARARVERYSDRVLVRFFGERDPRSAVSRLLFPRRAEMGHTDCFLMPATSRVEYSFGPRRRFIITSQCTPVSPDETEVYTLIAFRFGAVGPLVRLLFEPLSRIIIRQDVEILRLQGEQVRHFGDGPLVSTSADVFGPEIVRLWQSAVESGTDAGKHGAPLETRDVVLRF
ncbi:MAG TPA: aromatic ring-hydroxylating dioxygenase subunit alpha [candidate division Zixibacteria bacterium]|nr:aromatic ring-hydroxylating dioxygenase subunit alpha [candidate division Zixibacteria bacterium]